MAGPESRAVHAGPMHGSLVWLTLTFHTEILSLILEQCQFARGLILWGIIWLRNSSEGVLDTSASPEQRAGSHTVIGEFCLMLCLLLLSELCPPKHCRMKFPAIAYITAETTVKALNGLWLKCSNFNNPVNFPPQGKITSCDLLYAHLHGYSTLEAVVGLHIKDLIPSVQIPPLGKKMPKVYMSTNLILPQPSHLDCMLLSLLT